MWDFRFQSYERLKKSFFPSNKFWPLFYPYFAQEIKILARETANLWAFKKKSPATNVDLFFTHILPQKKDNFGKYLYVINADEIFICILIFTHMRIIRMNRIFPHPHGHPYTQYWKGHHRAVGQCNSETTAQCCMISERFNSRLHWEYIFFSVKCIILTID